MPCSCMAIARITFAVFTMGSAGVGEAFCIVVVETKSFYIAKHQQPSINRQTAKHQTAKQPSIKQPSSDILTGTCVTSPASLPLYNVTDVCSGIFVKTVT